MVGMGIYVQNLAPDVSNLKRGKTKVEYKIGWSVQLENNYRERILQNRFFYSVGLQQFW